MNNIHERRLTVLRNHVPAEVMLMLIGVSMVAMAFTGYHAGAVGAQRRIINLIMSITVAALIMMVVDLDGRLVDLSSCQCSLCSMQRKPSRNSNVAPGSVQTFGEITPRSPLGCAP